MREYKSVSLTTNQGWGGSKGTVNTDALDELLNRMARDGWELNCIEDLEHTAGSQTLLCVFSRPFSSTISQTK
jgi:hypothetical protein